MQTRYPTLVAIGALAVVFAACAGSGPGTSDDPRTIEISMTDQLRFDPESISVQSGETVRFVVDNPTALEHEFVIGDEHEQDHHAEEMMSGGMMHDDENAISVAPGDTGELVFTFGDPGDLLIGCHVDGHYAGGMIGHIAVEAR